MDRIWWTQMVKPGAFVHNIVDTLFDEQNVILQLPGAVPWYETFLSEVENGLIGLGCQREVTFAEYDDTVAPGEWLLNKFVKKEVRRTHRIGVSHASFLASLPDLTLHDSVVWIQNITEKGMTGWLSFIRDYRKQLPKTLSGALFVLEYRGHLGHIATGKAKLISFRSEISSYDRYAFCTLIASGSRLNAEVLPYLAELVSSVCVDDIELCAACIEKEEQFARDPESCLREIAQNERHSDGSVYSIEGPLAGLDQLVWKSQIRFVFPLLEQYRMSFVQKHWRDISTQLPYTNQFNETFSVPEEVELGLLYAFTSQGAVQMSDNEEFSVLRKVKDMRNDLAHLRPVSYEDILFLLAR